MPSLDDLDAAIDRNAPVDPLDAAIDGTAEMGRQKARASLYGAVRQNPDEYARAKQIERKTGLPAPLVARNLPEVQQRIALEDLDAAIGDSPVLGQLLQNPDFANLAHDDALSLAETEALIQGRMGIGKINGPPFRQPNVLQASRGPQPGFNTILSGIRKAFPQGAEATKQGLRYQFADAIGSEEMATDAARKAAGVQSDIFLSTPDFESSTASGLYGGGTSLLRQVPGIAASLLTRSTVPALGAAGIQTEAEAYSKYRLRGATPGEAFLGATAEGSTEVLTELLPMSFLVSKFGKAGAGEFLTGLLARELPTEQVATFVQDAVDTATANPDKTWGQFLEERPDAAYQTLLATIVQTGTMAAGHTAVQRLTAPAQQAEAAQQNAEALGKLTEIAKASKLRERDPQSFQDFVDAAAAEGPVQDVYVDARTFAQSLANAGVTPEQVAQASPTVAAQIEEALKSGGDLSIPIGEYMTTIAPTDAGSVLLPHLRTEPEGMSQAEATEFMQSQAEQFQAEVEKVMSEKQTDTAFQESAAKVEAHFAEQLSGANRFTGDVNGAYSKLASSFYTVQASRLGITPEAMLQHYPLQVRAESVRGATVMDQPGYNEDYGFLPDSAAQHQALDGPKLEALRGAAAGLEKPESGVTLRVTPEGQAIATGPKGAKVPQSFVKFAEENGLLFMAQRRLPSPTLGGEIDGHTYSKPMPLNYRVGGALYFNEMGDAWLDRTGKTLFQGDANGASRNQPAIGTATGQELHGTIAGGNPRDGWIESTRIRGTNNRPVTLHRGAALALAPEHFDAASLGVATNRPSAGLGVWFTVDPQEAASYGEAEEFYLDIRNPLIVKADELPGFDSVEAAHGWREEQRAAGYDGLIVTARHLGGRVHTVAFDAEQVIYPPPPASIDVTEFFQSGLQDGAVSLRALADEGNDQAIVAQSLIDRASSFGPQNLGDVIKGVSLIPEADRLGGVPALAPVFAEMRRAILEEPKVLNAIIGSVPVDMVNNLFGSEGAAKVALHDEAMLQYSPAFDAELPVAGGGETTNPVGLLVREVAFLAAKTFSSTTDARGKTAEPRPALMADKGNGFSQEGSPNRAKIAFGADITSTPSVISLLKNADLSSFLHELGHFQLEVLTSLATQPNAPQEVHDDANAVLKWFGVSDLQTWANLPLEEKRGYHEQFARGFEAYLFEGNAPNPELSGVFARFRAWLLNVYKSIKALNVELTPEVRGVFDRLIATDEQIQAAEAVRNYAPLFKTAEEAGMTAQEFADYQALGAEATQEAVDQLQTRSLRDMQWLRNARSRVLKGLQKEAEAKRRAVRAEVRSEVLSQPVYRAWAFLTGKLSAEDRITPPTKPGEQVVNLSALNAGRLDRGSLDVSTPEAIARVEALRMVAKDGLHPDLVAEMFGFHSGDELLQKLAAAYPPSSEIEGRTDQRMLERYGDINSPEALQRATDAAVHNDLRGRVIATELKALDKAVGKKPVLTKAAKQFAEQIIARKKVRDVKPAQFLAAEARAAKAAEKAKTLPEKATEKRNQLVNHYAARSAQDAVSEAEKALSYLKKFDTEGTRKAIDPDYIDQIDAMLERFDLRSGQSLKAIDKRKALADWIAAQEALGFEPTISDDLRNEALRKSYKDLTVEEFRGLVDAVKNIEHLGRLKKKLLTAADGRAFAVVVDEMAESIRANAKQTLDERRVSDRGFLVDASKIFKNFFADHRKFASLAREMDGWQDAGPLWEYLVRSMNKAGDTEAVMREQATIRLTELLKPILAEGGMGKKQYFASADKAFTREERIGIALNMGNETNRERVASGEALTPQALRDVLDTLTQKDWDFVQGVWDYLESYRPLIAEKERRLTGTTPEWVEPSPVNTKFGEYKGGYYPIKYDPERSTRAEADTASEVQRQIERGLYTRAQTRRGHLKARAESTGRPLRYDLNVIIQHVDQVVHDISWHEFLIDANRILRADPIDTAVREHYGPEKLRTMRDTLTDIAIGDLGAQSSGERILNYIRHGATIAGLGWRVTTSLLQPFGLTQSMSRIGSKWVLRGAKHWAGDAIRMEGSLKQIEGKSDFMRLRAKTLQREVNEIRNKVSGKDSRIEASYFYLIQKMQLIADVPTWWGAYEKALSEADMSEDKAVALADQAVRDSQGAGQIGDLAAIQRGGAGWKLFTNFYSFFNTTYNLTAEAVGRTDFKKPGDVGLLGVDLLLLYSIPAMLATLLKAALAGDWDDEDKLARRMIADQLTFMLGTVVLLREAGGAVQSALGLHGDYGGPASVRIFGEITKLAKQAEQGEADEAFLKALNSAAGILFHYPAGQINATASGVAAIAEGKTENPGALLVGAPKH